jgi:hypothetical protein
VPQYPAIAAAELTVSTMTSDPFDERKDAARHFAPTRQGGEKSDVLMFPVEQC